jgi:hypothetical protein
MSEPKRIFIGLIVFTVFSSRPTVALYLIPTWA